MASEFHHGDMDIHEQQATYHLFMAMTKWGSLALAALLVLLVLWFCTPAGFVGGLISAVVVVALGVLLLREPPAAPH